MVTREKDGKEYTYTIKETTSDGTPLTDDQLAERLAGNSDYEYKNGKFYYKGVEMDDLKINAVRHTLRYEVTVQQTEKKPGQEDGKPAAEEAAKTEAIKDALRNAAQKEGITLDDSELANIKLTGDTLTVTREKDGQTITYTFQYKGAEITSTHTDMKPSETTEEEDVKVTTVTGTAYVTSGTISWTKNGESGTYTASGTLKPGDTHIASKPAKPTGDNVTFTQEGDAAIYTVTTENEDGSTTETIYTFREAVVSLDSGEQKKAAWEALAKAENKTVQQLKDEGYTISDIKFDSVTKSTWTVETRTHTTDEKKVTLNQTLVDDTWTLTGTTLKTKDGQIYKNLKKNSDGTYTATKEDGDKTITYTFTLGVETDLDEPTIKAMLAAKFPESNGQITLDTTAKTATYKVGETTVTIDYRSLSKKTLKIDTSVSEAVSVTETIKTDQDLKDAQDRLYEALKEKVKSIKLQPGETLWIGDLQIKDIDSQKTEIIKHFTTAVSHENMSKDELIKALQEQERIAKNSTYVANAGSKYEETKKNYYSGEKTGEFKYFSKAPDGSKIEVYWKSTWRGGYYYYIGANGQEVRVHSNTVHYEEQRDDIKHLDLASDSKLDLLPDEDGKVDQTDCVLVSKDLKLEWNYNAGKLLADQSTLKDSDKNHTVGLDSKISWDDEGGKGNGHYEYDRGNPNNCPDKSAYYKLTGTVAYDPIKENGNIKLYQGGFDDYWYWVSAEDQAINAYLKATGSNKTAASLTKKERDAIVGTYVVKIGTTGTNSTGESGYQVYLKTSELTAYGYMTRDANTCINSTYKRQDGTWGYVGGYDLMISELTQVREGKVVGQTESTIKTITAPLSIRSSQDFANRLLELNQQTTTHKTSERATAYGENTSGGFDGAYTQNKSETVTGSGTGKGHYTTFTEVLKKLFSGKGETTYDEGKVSYTYRTTDKVDTTPVSKETVTTTDAHVDYNYTSIETRTVTVDGEETVIVPPVTPPVDPDTPDGPVEDETPDEVVTPETPELPPVQDATPDDAAPETPVLPSDAVLPAVQDALPQTGVNWMAALGMAFSGMLLMVVGAFASLKYKEKH